MLIDFTRPEGTLAHLAVCRAKNVKMVIGTTGFSPEQKEELKAASRDIAIVLAPNMSVGVNVTLKLLEMAARVLNEGYDVEIIEAHHRHKVDAPPALRCRWARWWQKRWVEIFPRLPFSAARAIRVSGLPSIGFATVRGGDIVGTIP